ncbi:MAG: alpha-(1-_3)-arabinofuranosyltransferase domain-containing protein [Acidimicrobiales bacterium]
MVALLAALSYVPLLLTDRGQVGSDTKPYLYLDPGALLADAPSLWQPEVGLGSVPHQNIGYLWPMGPYFWLMETLGLPDWVAQRLWIGTTILLAGLGVRYLLRTLGWRTPGIAVAVFAYALSPYGLAYFARISALLLPWAGLPWLIALTIKSTRTQGWRHPAAFALVAVSIGSINATSLLLVGLAPAMWIFYEMVIRRSWTPIFAALRIGLLTAGCSLWWVAGVTTQGRYGPNVLRFTETYEAVADSSTAPEVLRGLGYWFFYGNDHLGQWIEPSRAYTARTVLLVLSFALPVAALAAAAFTRWRHRAYFVALIVVGALVAVGSHPFDAPSVLGELFRESTKGDFGLALRSTPRVIPLVVLGTAVLLGAGSAAVVRRLPRLEVPVIVGVIVLVALNFPPLFNGQLVSRHLQRPEEIPDYWTAAIADLDADGPETRILEVPGADFTSYRWGNTIEPVTPGLTDRPYVARELVPFGSEPSISLQIAFDRQFQEGLYSPESLAPLVRLMSVGDVVFRSDLKYERFRTPRPPITWADLQATPGLDEPVVYGPTTPNVAGPEHTMIDELALAMPADAEHPPAVSAFGVDDTLPLVRTHPEAGALVVAGDAEALVDLAALGMLDPDRLIVFSASLADDPEQLDTLLDAGATVVVSDQNRRQARRWGSIRENAGYVERADEEPIRYDPGDYRLEVFDNTSSDLQTVSVQTGAQVSATAYGNPVSLTVNDRPSLAVDGDPNTAWRVGAFAEVRNERLVIELDEAIPVSEITLLQPVTGFRERNITELRVDRNGHVDDVLLDESSLAQPGQRVLLDEVVTDRIELEVLASNLGVKPRYNGASAVGFAEVAIPGVDFDEVLRLPIDLAAHDTDDNPFQISLSRIRSNPQEPVRSDGEERLRRAVELASPRTFELTGEARLSSYAPESTINDLIGWRGTDTQLVEASEYLPGDLTSRGASAIDREPTTAWQTEFNGSEGATLRVMRDQPTTLDTLTLDLYTDNWHSVPTVVSLRVDGEEPMVVPVPDLADTPTPFTTSRVELALPAPVTGTEFELVIEEVREVLTKDWYSSNPISMPIGIVEIAELADSVTVPDTFDDRCRLDLVSVDGVPVGISLGGSSTATIDREPLSVRLCDGPIDLGGGRRLIESEPGRSTGIDVDRLAFASSRPQPIPESAPTATVVASENTEVVIDLQPSAEPYWLVLGQSQNAGWEASGLDGSGQSTLVAGFANGWRVEPHTETLRVTLTWTPQTTVDRAIVISLLFVIAALVLLVVGRPDRGPASRMDRQPIWGSPRRGSVSSRLLGVACVGVGLFTFVNLPEWRLLSILAMAALWFTVRGGRWARRLPALGAAVALAVAGAYITIEQYRNRYPPDFGWPQFFDAVHVVGVVAVLLLAVDVVASMLAPLAPETDEDR